MKTTLTLLAVTAALSIGTSAFAQDHSGHDATSTDTAANALPDICKPAMQHEMPAMDMSGMEGMDAGHMALMEGMDQMHTDMMQGMMAENIDVAFVCGMIPHHQGAIDMARAELEHGTDPWAKEMAQKIIDAQEQEIADMLAWLEDRVQ